VTFAAYRVSALLAKELAELRRNRVALVPVLILAIVTVALPFLIALVIPMIVGEPLAADPEFARAVKRSAIPQGIRMSDEAAVQTFIFQQFMLLQLLIPVTGAMAFAGYSLIGEKQGRTLEPLLATPITTAELLIAKGLGALLPSLGIMVVALAVYLAGMLAFAAPHVFSAVVSARTALLVMGFGPVAALVALQIAVLVSSRVNDPRTAQQFGALLILPITAVFVMQFNGVIRLTVPVITMALVALCALWVLLVVLGVALFEREAILTRWK
jgi:ABC-2 type transport system permease protein